MARFFEQHDVHYMVLELLPIQDLRTYGLVCERTYDAVKDYLRQTTTVTRMLKTFINKDDISAFRRMQHTTGAIIGGSAALQFFTRQQYASSDLDLYVHTTNKGKVCCALKKMRCSKDPKRGPEGNIVSPPSVYLGHSVQEIINFTTSKNRKIQLIVTRRRPVDVILAYHSSKSLLSNNAIALLTLLCSHSNEFFDRMVRLFSIRQGDLANGSRVVQPQLA